jgi:serine/threonine protein phosphatase PrpC
MSTTIAFKKKFPYLIKPIDKGDIRNKMPDFVSYLQVEMFEYHEVSVLPNADAASIIGGRFGMEDTYKIAKLSNSTEFYGVFDGHGGWEISALLKDVLAKKFEDLLQSNKTFDYTNVSVVTELIRTVCLDLGKEIFELINCRTIGSTAVFALRFGQYLYLVNIGDSTGVVIDNQGNLLIKTKNHKPDDKDEKNRIEKHGAKVSNGRVNGQLAVSRSFGDNYYNSKHQKMYSGFETVVTHEPDIYSFVIPPEPENCYLILGSDGLWDNCSFENIIPDETINTNKFTFKQLADIVISKSPRQASLEIVELAYHSGVGDNITAVVVALTDNYISAEPPGSNDVESDDVESDDVELESTQPIDIESSIIVEMEPEHSEPIDIKLDSEWVRIKQEYAQPINATPVFINSPKN